MRPLFADAPVMQPAQQMPVQVPHSALAAALSGPSAPISFPSASMPQVPLSSIQNAFKDQGTGSTVTSATPNLAWNPNNPVGTDTLGGNTANQGNAFSNAWATYGAGSQGGGLGGMLSRIFGGGSGS